jgi:ABC-type sugar transport system ATPase subunit
MFGLDCESKVQVDSKHMSERTPIISLKGCTKRFGGVLAVNQVDLDIYPGEVHGLVGENGAGKSTLMRILAGFYPDYEGQIYIQGKLERITSPREAMGLGIALVHQELSLVPELTVAENIFLGREHRSRVPGLIARSKIEENAERILSEVEAGISPKSKVRNLSIAKQQLVEISKGVSMESKVLILDEPTSSLTAPEIKDLFKIIRKLKDRGTAVVYISHKLAEVFEIANQVTVLRDGVKLETRPTPAWDEASLVRSMVGRELESFFSNSHKYDPKEVALEVSRFTRKPHFEDISFKVYKGEVLGIYGLIGAGRTELAESIVGLRDTHSGELHINGKLVHIGTTQDAIAHEISLVPEDRRTLGLISLMDVRSNLSLPILHRLTVLGFVKRKEEQELVSKNVQSLEIRIPSLKSLVTSLSGGNQQKVVLGKWLNANPKVLILDDPTRGIDVGAKAEIRGIIDRLAGEGRAIILISSELPEIIGMSDRVLVMRMGRIVGEFAREQCSDETLGACAAGIKMALNSEVSTEKVDPSNSVDNIATFKARTS